MSKQLRMVEPKPEHLEHIWANLATDDKHELGAGLFPPAGPTDLAAWSGAWSGTGCITSCVILLDGLPIAYVGVSTAPGANHLNPWGITVQDMGMSPRQTAAACVAVWSVLRARTLESLAGRAGEYVAFVNMCTINHKRSRALLPILGFTFTGNYWTSPSGVQFEVFEAPTNV